MKVSHFNTFPYGGAAYAARRIHEGLIDSGVDSTFFYWKNERDPLGDDYQQISFEPTQNRGLLRPVLNQLDKIRQRKIKRSYDKHIRPRSSTLEVFSGAKQLMPTQLDWVQVQADVMHLHWLAFMVDYPSFFQSIDDRIPLVWTLHDMNPFTGGCHYSSGCQKFKEGCGICPQLVNPSKQDESTISFNTKLQSLRRKHLTVVAPSEWMLKLARTSPMFAECSRFELIRYGFDLEVLKPLKKSIARRQLGISNDESIVIGFGAEDINQRRKGLHLLLESLRKLSVNKPVIGLVFGTGNLPSDFSELPPIHSVGFVDSIPRKALIYSAMDMFAMPSIEDNSPQTGLEAMACGTPVVAFHTGGVPEYVSPFETGLLAPVGNTDKFAEHLSWLANNNAARMKISHLARDFMLKYHSVEMQSKRYTQLYHQLMDSRHSWRRRSDEGEPLRRSRAA